MTRLSSSTTFGSLLVLASLQAHATPITVVMTPEKTATNNQLLANFEQQCWANMIYEPAVPDQPLSDSRAAQWFNDTVFKMYALHIISIISASFKFESLYFNFESTDNTNATAECTQHLINNTAETEWYEQFKNQTVLQLSEAYLATYEASEKGRGLLNEIPLSGFEHLSGMFSFL